MKGHRINFFASRNDMLELFGKLPLKFVPCGCEGVIKWTGSE